MEIQNACDCLYEDAEKSLKKGEIPVSALLNIGKKIYRASNAVEKKNDPLAHAEIQVIQKALKDQKTRYLTGATLFVSLEPCLMCLGAILKTGISNLCYVLDDPKAGALSHYHVFVDDVLQVSQIDDPRFAKLMNTAFDTLRKKRK